MDEIKENQDSEGNSKNKNEKNNKIPETAADIKIMEDKFIYGMGFKKK